MHDYTFDDLRFMYYTGRSYVKSGTGRDRVYGYRNGVQTKIGDLEVREWRQLMLDLIERAGEKDLFHQLLLWEKEQNVIRLSKDELEFEALRDHSYRLFDDPEWVDFVAFNQRFRPGYLESTTVSLCRIMPDCCRTPGLVTQAMIDRGLRCSGGTVCCPICGKWTTFSLLPK